MRGMCSAYSLCARVCVYTMLVSHHCRASRMGFSGCLSQIFLLEAIQNQSVYCINCELSVQRFSSRLREE